MDGDYVEMRRFLLIGELVKTYAIDPLIAIEGNRKIDLVINLLVLETPNIIKSNKILQSKQCVMGAIKMAF